MLAKKIAILVCQCLVVAYSAIAQVTPGHGYIAIGVGPSFLAGYKTVDQSNPGVGANLALINFNYDFGIGIGVSAVWTRGSHHFNTEWIPTAGNGRALVKSDWEVRYGAVMIGPMYSLTFSNNSALQFKARCGWFKALSTATSTNSSGTGTYDNSSPGYSLAVSYEKNIAPNWCLLIASDYYSNVVIDSYFIMNERVAAISITAGIGFLFE